MKNFVEVEPGVFVHRGTERSVTVIGTAHVSEKSAALVRRIIEAERPSSILVELCQPRLEALKNPERWKETDIFEIIKSGKSLVLFAQLILASFQKRLAAQFGVEPGGDMRTAIKLAEELGIELGTIDREVRLTLRRAWAKTGLWSMTKLLSSAVLSMFSKEEITEAEIEALKEGDALTAALLEFSNALPRVKSVLIDERDQFMAKRIFEAKGPAPLAVVGAGHIPGIDHWFGLEIDESPLLEIPEPSPVWKVLGWSIPAIIIGLFVYGWFFSGVGKSIEMMSWWFFGTGGGAAAGVLLAGGHPLSMVAAFFAAPVAALHPAIATGWFAGLTEAVFRKPKVKDFETIAEDLSSVWGLWKNQVTRILLVTAFANLGCILGALLASVKLVSLLE